MGLVQQGAREHLPAREPALGVVVAVDTRTAASASARPTTPSSSPASAWAAWSRGHARLPTACSPKPRPWPTRRPRKTWPPAACSAPSRTCAGVTAKVAEAVVREARETGLGTPPTDPEIESAVAAAMWQPGYLPLAETS